MNDNLLQKAKDLKDKIEKVKSKIKVLEDYKQNYGEHYTLKIEYIMKDKGLVQSFEIHSSDKNKDELLEARYCCDIVVSNLFEFYRRKLDRLEFEYQNL